MTARVRSSATRAAGTGRMMGPARSAARRRRAHPLTPRKRRSRSPHLIASLKAWSGTTSRRTCRHPAPAPTTRHAHRHS
jgi:hypothetical protein